MKIEYTVIFQHLALQVEVLVRYRRNLLDIDGRKKTKKKKEVHAQKPKNVQACGVKTLATRPTNAAKDIIASRKSVSTSAWGSGA